MWASPIIVGGAGREVKICLYPEKDHIAFEVQTLNSDKKPVIHSQGNLIIGQTKEDDRKNIDILAIQKQCKKQMTAKACYSLFSKNGLNYGPSFQGIQELYVGDNEALARIKLPGKVSDQKEKFQLHPSLMDAALQTTMGLSAVKKGETALPFALGELNISQPLPDKVYVYTRYSKGVDPAGKIVKYDIDIVDEAGVVCVSFGGFTTRVFGAVEKKEADILYASPVWHEEKVERKTEKGKSEIKSGTLFLLGVTKESENKLKNELTGLKIEQLDTKSDASTITQNFQTVFKHIKEQLETKSKEVMPILVVAQGEENRQASVTFSGLFKTARIENPRIQGKVIEIESNEDQLSRIITEELESETFDDVDVRYTADLKREVKKLKEIKFGPETTGNKLIKEGGVYWIAGGMGGLGRIFAEHIGKTKDVKVILSGRSKLDNAKKEQLEILKEAGIDVEYIQSDVCIKDDVKEIVKSIKKKHSELNGIIYTAGIIRDAFIIKKTEEEIENVFKPKVNGIVNIDEVTREEKLDFIVIFSSITGAIGNVGQSDYAGANAFLDGYAEYRNDQVKLGRRTGKIISINWPLWKEGGMQIDENSEKMMERQTGVAPLPTTKGVYAFDQLLAQNSCVTAVVAIGNSSKIRDALKLNIDRNDGNKIKRVSIKEESSVNHKDVANDLITVFAKLLKVKKVQMDLETDFADYGIDSILMMKALNVLEERYQAAFDPTVITEYPTISELAS